MTTNNDNQAQIWTENGFVPDEWTSYELLPSVEVEGKVLLPISALKEAREDEKARL